jgi:hypothetical protein
MEKKINYLARDFQSIKKELIDFSKKYYPEISDNFNDASVGAWFIDLLSAVGDDLSYHTDRMYQETNINSANLRSSVLNLARINGVKIPGRKSSICEVELSIFLPINSKNISSPDWDYAPILKRGSIVGNSTYEFEVGEDVDFGQQFNEDGISNRKYSPIRDSNGGIIQYKVTKTVVVYGGKSRIYKKVLTAAEVVPFMEVIIPDKDICNVESIIFKETASFDEDPQIFEFYIDEEEFWVLDEDIPTYRYFEVDSLSDQYRFGCMCNFIQKSEEGREVIDINNPEVYEDVTETSSGSSSTRTSRYFKGVWKPLMQKYMTEFTDNNYMKIIFGGATDADQNKQDGTEYYQYVASKIINNNMLGLLPKAGWTMYVLYRTSGGVDANLGIGAINKIINANFVFPKDNENLLNTDIKSGIIRSLKVMNNMTAIAGKDAPSIEEVKYLTKYSVGAQKRCVTLKDYKAMVMQMPPKYGCPFRCNAIEDNNKISMSILGVNGSGKLTNIFPKILGDNIVSFLSHFKSLTDYVEIKSGKIFHLGIDIDVFIDKNYTTADVIATIINCVKNYMDINRYDIGEDIFLGDMERQINDIDGVISLINIRVYGISGGDYSSDKCPLPMKTIGEGCNVSQNVSFTINTANTFEIDLNAIDHVLYADYDSMFEIKNPLNDIRVRAKIR